MAIWNQELQFKAILCPGVSRLHHLMCNFQNFPGEHAPDPKP